MKIAQNSVLRGLVVGMLIVFVGVEVTQRDWSWVGVGTVLLLANIASWRHQLSGAGRPATPGADGTLVPHDVDLTLGALLDRPSVRQARDAAPAVWQQVLDLVEEVDLSMEASDVAELVWLTTDDAAHGPWHWSVAVGDELKPLLDLDVPEDQDPFVATVSAHPAVADVAHVDREEYAVVLRSPMTLDEMAVLAVHGLVAHHRDAVRRLKRT
ncbi:hypothetical protein [Nocardioides sp. B-3]|uniref:hypothetical protein n=1 Tax=Nocardioides sp. B-3 TaxID=2895565 RepID=UPI002153456F|nr:hypothetical protein [Nocardioides sp. B-3]UUZ60448.1 hypothetical protein LP418_06045 [Nocardioides sp. B-3]